MHSLEIELAIGECKTLTVIEKMGNSQVSLFEWRLSVISFFWFTVIAGNWPWLSKWEGSIFIFLILVIVTLVCNVLFLSFVMHCEDTSSVAVHRVNIISPINLLDKLCPVDLSLEAVSLVILNLEECGHCSKASENIELDVNT